VLASWRSVYTEKTKCSRCTVVGIGYGAADDDNDDGGGDGDNVTERIPERAAFGCHGARQEL